LAPAEKERRVNYFRPATGNKKQLIQIVRGKRRQGLKQMKVKHLPLLCNESALNELQEKLGLPRQPERIEGYDISNIQGKEAVGSMVVFLKRPRQAFHTGDSVLKPYLGQRLCHVAGSSR